MGGRGAKSAEGKVALPEELDSDSVKDWLKKNTKLPLVKGPWWWRERVILDPLKREGRAGLSGNTVIYSPHGEKAERISEILHEVKAWNLGEGMEIVKEEPTTPFFRFLNGAHLV